MNPKLLIYILTALAITATACSDESYNDRIMLSNLVSINSVDETEGTTFTFRRYDDSPIITLVDPKLRIKEDYVGARALLYYYPEGGQAYESGRISASGITIVNSDTTIVRPISRYNWDASPVFLNSVWRTGEFLNFRMRIDYSEQPRYFGLVVDSLTLTDPEPQLYLVHDLNGSPDNFLRENYASFDITNVWDQPTCRAIVVHVNDINLNKDIYKFTKN
ncbi:MAG: hypothetical protein NC127_08640 [Muribaculum sp.]|nr:hypothetical protein [Muribaculum sp.]